MAEHAIDAHDGAAVLDDAKLVIAHSARFDRPHVETRLPGLFETIRWGCSCDDL